MDSFFMKNKKLKHEHFIATWRFFKNRRNIKNENENRKRGKEKNEKDEHILKSLDVFLTFFWAYYHS
jgi:hypothetical protein